MRVTLEQLKTMTGEQLVEMWSAAGGNQFPFDLADCGACLTLHALDSHARCHPLIHQRLLELDADEGAWNLRGLPVTIKTHIEELYALRLFYDYLYPHKQETTDAVEETVQEEKVSV
jgi:hypothetical protein